MACSRDRIINFIQKQGIEVNIGKNKAQGNRGFFKAVNNSYRIDISKNLGDDDVLHVLTHEFVHFLHYKNDKKMESFDFLFDKVNNDIIEELIKLTVDSIPKEEISPLMQRQAELKQEINKIALDLKSKYLDFRLSEKYTKLEKKIPFSYKYLLKYDKVRVFQGFSVKTYTIDDIDNYILSDDVKLYIILKSKQRIYKKISSKIAKLNRYYNKPSELLARSFEKYIFDEEYVKQEAPLVYNNYKNIMSSCKYPLLNKFVQLLR